MSPAFRTGSLLDRVFGGKQERALAPPGVSMFGGMGVPAPWKPQEALDSYDYNVYVYRCVQTIAMAMAGVQLHLQTRNEKGEITRIERHQAIETMRRPQETKSGKSQLSGMTLRIVTGMHLLLDGEGFWVFEKRTRSEYGGAPTYIDLALPQSVRLKMDSDNEIENYFYRADNGREKVIDPLDVVHFKIPDQKNWLRGHSPIQSIRYAVDTQRKADSMNTKKLDNNAVPAGTLKTEQNPTDEQRAKIGASSRQNYSGPENAGKVAMLPNGFEFQVIGESNRDMQFIEGKGIVRDEILANYGVGPEILGKTESQTRANAETAVFIFQKFGVLPYLELFVDALNNDYLPAFPGTEGMEFAFDDPVPENMEDKRANADSLATGGALTPTVLLPFSYPSIGNGVTILARNQSEADEKAKNHPLNM